MGADPALPRCPNRDASRAPYSQDKRKFTAKVCDFGLSKVLEHEGVAMQTRTMGTVTHMPPEMLSEGKASTAADVFAFGVIMW